MHFADTGPYYNAMDREYVANRGVEPVNAYAPEAQIEGGPAEAPLFEANELGQTVTEGRQFGTFVQSMQAAIRAGAGTVELATQMAGTDRGVGAEAYGKEAREELRAIADANQVKITGVHTPTQVGNLSGYTGPERGFSHEQRKIFLDEVKRAVHFLADVSPHGGAVVVHTGEYQRPISDQPWARDPETGKLMFKGYEEEPQKAVIPLVDERTGQVLTQVRKSQIVARAKWNRYEQDNKGAWEKYSGQEYTDEKGNKVRPGDYIDYEGNRLERENRIPMYDRERNRFVVVQQKWEDFEKEAEEMNAEKERKLGRPLMEDERITPEEAFLHATTETQEKIAEGWAGIYARDLDKQFDRLAKLKKALTFYEQLEKNIPEEEKWRIMKDIPEFDGTMLDQFVPGERKTPAQILQDQIQRSERDLLNYREAVVGQTQSAEEQRILRAHAISASKYAKKESIKSYAEAAIYAMDKTKEKKLDKPVFVAPENLFPEMGWGTHPQELRDLILSTREEMVKQLVKERHMSEAVAKKAAENHIKATFDFQHLGMWWKHFEPLYAGEPEEERKKRFDAWYLKEVKQLIDEDLIGNLHVVDGMGGAHHHLPPGQGVFPIKTVLEYMKQKGYTGAMSSEAWEEGPARQLTKYWEYMGAYSRPTGLVGPVAPGGPQRWSDVFQSYFGQTYPPNYIFGAYSPSNDWTLWSQVPME